MQIERKNDRRMVQRSIDASLERLCGPLSGAIEYLREVQSLYPQAELCAEGDGYDGVDLTFEWQREETDNEYYSRKKKEREEEEESRRRADRERNARRRKIQDEIDTLKRQMDKI